MEWSDELRMETPEQIELALEPAGLGLAVPGATRRLDP